MEKKEILFKNRLDNGEEGEYERSVMDRSRRFGGLLMCAVLTVLVAHRLLSGNSECFDLIALAFSTIAGERTYQSLRLRDRKLVFQAVLGWLIVASNLFFYMA